MAEDNGAGDRPAGEGGKPGGKSDTVTLPGVGKIKKRNLYLALAIVAGIAGTAWFFYLRSGAPVDTTTTETPEQDYIPDDVGGGGGYYYGSGAGGGGGVIGEAIATNAQWFTVAMEALEAAGWDAQAAATALGKYLQKAALNPSEVTMVQVALAAAGPPPEGGPYSLVTGGNPPTPSGKPAKPTGVTAKYTGSDAAGGKAEVRWNAVPGAVRYRVDVDTMRLEVTEYNVRTTGTLRYVRGLKPGKHIALVVAVNAAGVESDRGGPASFTVPLPEKPKVPKQSAKTAKK